MIATILQLVNFAWSLTAGKSLLFLHLATLPAIFLSAIFSTTSAGLITFEIQKTVGEADPFQSPILNIAIDVSTSANFRAFTWIPVALSWFSLLLTAFVSFQKCSEPLRRHSRIDLRPATSDTAPVAHHEPGLGSDTEVVYLEQLKSSQPHSEPPRPANSEPHDVDTDIRDMNRHSDVSSLSSDASVLDEKPGAERRLSAL
ncbi:MAG: hypothetical protein MMC23_006251 [Stictis urceolatum]|nr:hypothetical protein [Stictis urceolata]